MIHLEQLSYWERRFYFDSIDFLIVGSGIVGLTAAIQLRQEYPEAKIVILERGYLPTGASTKNAGFACFGSPSELLDDLKTMREQSVWETVEMRYHGLERLLKIVDKKTIDYEQGGSWELFENINGLPTKDEIAFLNTKLQHLLGEKDIYEHDKQSILKFGLKNFSFSIKNRLEGSLSTDKLMHQLLNKATKLNIHTFNGIVTEHFENKNDTVTVSTNFGNIEAKKVLVCTNAFTKKLIQPIDVKPARAQVLITKPIKNLQLAGTFHSNRGYYYFRNVGNRILLGGARCMDVEGETTEKFENTENIKLELTRFLKHHFVDGEKMTIDYFWSGIMGTGTEKKPLVQKINNNVYCGVRMGGMGIAIGSEIGHLLVKQILHDTQKK